jgi:hypothetical protein
MGVGTVTAFNKSNLSRYGGYAERIGPDYKIALLRYINPFSRRKGHDSILDTSSNHPAVCF